MSRFILLAWCCAAVANLVGCGSKLDPPVDPDEAGTALRAALGAWKQGEEHDALQRRNPPVYFREPEWQAGKKLERFEVGPVELLGRQGRCSVKLVLRDGKGQVSEREVSYLVDTTPQVVIVREGLGP